MKKVLLKGDSTTLKAQTLVVVISPLFPSSLAYLDFETMRLLSSIKDWLRIFGQRMTHIGAQMPHCVAIVLQLGTVLGVLGHRGVWPNANLLYSRKDLNFGRLHPRNVALQVHDGLQRLRHVAACLIQDSGLRHLCNGVADVVVIRPMKAVPAFPGSPQDSVVSC